MLLLLDQEKAKAISFVLLLWTFLMLTSGSLTVQRVV